MNAESPPRRTSFWPIVIVCVLLAAAVLVQSPQDAPSAAMPDRLPPLEVQGWLNAPAAPEVEGRVVVLDAWATWCGPCIGSLPGMVETHKQYGDRALFIGLTPENASKREQVESTIARFEGFDWPVGYGASPTLQALGVTGIPALFVFDEQGKAVWAGHSVPELRAQLERVL